MITNECTKNTSTKQVIDNYTSMNTDKHTTERTSKHAEDQHIIHGTMGGGLSESMKVAQEGIGGLP